MVELGRPVFRILFYVAAITVLVFIFLSQYQLTSQITLIRDYWHFVFIGIFAATVANATGVGGGVVFIPAFLLLGFSVSQSLATSFAIQCFGMSSGAITWLALARRESNRIDHCWEQLNPVLLLTIPSSVAGLLVAQQFFSTPFFDIHWLFSCFSITIGLLMLYRLYHHYHAEEFHSPVLNTNNKLILIATTFVGGIITWWLSIGVGEILAVVLLMLGFNMRFSVTVAVVVSAASVWVALPYYLFEEDVIDRSVVLFAGPAALIGGFVARYLAMAVGALRAKIGLSLWILFSGFAYILLK